MCNDDLGRVEGVLWLPSSKVKSSREAVVDRYAQNGRAHLKSELVRLSYDHIR
jgi:hypothetical protein